MPELTEDELTVLGIVAQGEYLAPVGRWKPTIFSLADRGLMQKVDEFNYVITDSGRAAHKAEDDDSFRRILESGNKIANARTQAQQSVEQAALHLSHAAKASILVTGDSPEHAVASWLDIVKERALDLMRNG